MRKQDCEYMKERVQRDLINARHGLISLMDMCRLFGDFGTEAEIERCLDRFVSSGFAEKKTVDGDRIYVFISALRDWAGKVDEEMGKIEVKDEELKAEIEGLKAERKVVEEMRESWVSGWEDVELEEREMEIRNYVASFWGLLLENTLSALQAKEAEAKNLERKKMMLQREVDSIDVFRPVL